MKKLTHIPMVNDHQLAFGAKVDLDLRDCTVSMATARIDDAIDVGFHGIAELGSPTPKQVELAAKFGYDISEFSRREGNAILDDLMMQLNRDAIESESLARGVVVINTYDSLNTRFEISSIQPDGMVYFRGGNGRKASARNLRRAPNDAPSDMGRTT